MKTNNGLIAMAYNQFWDNFNWELYQKINIKNNTFWNKFNWDLYQRIILIKLKYDR
jgi:hypothetical protein